MCPIMSDDGGLDGSWEIADPSDDEDSFVA